MNWGLKKAFFQKNASWGRKFQTEKMFFLETNLFYLFLMIHFLVGPTSHPNNYASSPLTDHKNGYNNKQYFQFQWFPMPSLKIQIYGKLTRLKDWYGMYNIFYYQEHKHKDKKKTQTPDVAQLKFSSWYVIKQKLTQTESKNIIKHLTMVFVF